MARGAGSQKPPLGTARNGAWPFWRDMVDCLVFNEIGSQSIYNYAAPYHAAGVSAPTWAHTLQGVAGAVTGGSSWDIPDHAVYSEAVTIRVIHRPTTWPSGFTALFDKQAAGDREASVFVDTNGDLSFVEFGRSEFATKATGMAAGSVWDFVMTKETSATDVTAYYVNGLLKASGALVSGDPTSNSGVMSIGANPSGGGAAYNGSYLLFQAWTRVLTADDIWSLYLRPYDFLIQPVRRPFVKIPAAAAAPRRYLTLLGVGA